MDPTRLKCSDGLSADLMTAFAMFDKDSLDPDNSPSVAHQSHGKEKGICIREKLISL
jgi:hypothetical protein